MVFETSFQRNPKQTGYFCRHCETRSSGKSRFRRLRCAEYRCMDTPWSTRVTRICCWNQSKGTSTSQHATIAIISSVVPKSGGPKEPWREGMQESLRRTCLGRSQQKRTLLMSSLNGTSAWVTRWVGPRIVWYEVMPVIFNSAKKREHVVEDGAHVAGR